MQVDILKMLTLHVTLLAQAVAAVSFPPPSGPYYVGYTQQVLNNTTPNDPVAPKNASSSLLVTIYYPTLMVPVPGTNTAPYFDRTTAAVWGDAFQYPNNSLQGLTTWNVYQAPPLDIRPNGETLKPTIIFSPASGQNAIMYNALNSGLASQGYTVVALDHPGEAPYLQLPNGQGIYGISFTTDLNNTAYKAIYNMRVSDILAVARKLFPLYVNSTNAPFNTTHYLAVGHSIGGAAAAGALAVEPSILGGVNLDGGFFDLPDVKKPFLMVAGSQHTPALDPSWYLFSANQSGPYQWLNVTGTSHQDFSDIGDWVDLQGLRNKTITPALGTIWAPRMSFIVRTLVESFAGVLLGEQKRAVWPNSAFPEVRYINGSAWPLEDSYHK